MDVCMIKFFMIHFYKLVTFFSDRPRTCYTRAVESTNDKMLKLLVNLNIWGQKVNIYVYTKGFPRHILKQKEHVDS